MLDVDQVDAAELPSRWNVAPTQPVYAVLHDRRGARSLTALRWGLIPHWATDARIGSRLINARGETAAQRPAFRDAMRARRAALVFDGFYEWRRPAPGQKGPAQPFYFHRADGQPLVLAGLWETWRDGEGRPVQTCAIVTTSANATMAPVHHRMPVILSPGSWADWLSPSPMAPHELGETLVPAPDDVLAAHPVAATVNDVRNDGPELVLPAPELVLGQELRLWDATSAPVAHGGAGPSGN
jgi:putative SOS response-associated peptidase YedK